MCVGVCVADYRASEASDRPQNRFFKNTVKDMYSTVASD